MEVRLLGPPAVIVDGRPRVIGGPRAQIVLAVLALEANRCVPIERLMDAVWEQNPPPTARTQIQICVSGLRRQVVGPEAVRTHVSGYRLVMRAEQLDVTVFEKLAAEGDFDAALSVWRGPALSGLPGALVASYRQQLEEKRLTVIEERLQRDLSRGQHARLVGELFQLVDEHPSREKLHAHLMLALYRSGRWADALAAYRRAHQTFVTELGVEPTGELRRLEHAILTHDPRLDPPAPAAARPGLLPSDIAGFTGRAGEILRARQALDRDAGAVPVVAVTGPPGAGKSALALRIAHESLESYPDGQLYACLEQTAAPEVLRLFLRCLGLPAVPEGSVQELSALYRACLAGRRVLIVLDGVTDAGQVRPLVPGTPSCGMVIAGRPSLAGLAVTERIRLTGLSPREGARLLAAVAGRGPLPHATRLAQLCDGLPRALRTAGMRLADRPHWSADRLAARLSDETKVLDELEIRDIFSGYGELPAPARKLLWRLSLLDAPDMPGWICAAVLGGDPQTGDLDPADLLDQLVDADLVQPTAAPAARYRMGNLTRAFAREEARRHETRAVAEQAVRRALTAWVAHGPQPGEHAALTAGLRQAARIGWPGLGCQLGLLLISAPPEHRRPCWPEAVDVALACAREAGNVDAEAAFLRARAEPPADVLNGHQDAWASRASTSA